MARSLPARRTWLDWSLLLLCGEKIVQHAVLALLFAVNVPGIGAPDIGTRFTIPDAVMAGLNVVYALLLVLALFALWRHRPGRLAGLALLAGADIVLEFVFHGPGFITVSVIVSTLVLFLVALAVWRERQSA